MGADEARAPRAMWGYLSRNQEASTEVKSLKKLINAKFLMLHVLTI